MNTIFEVSEDKFNQACLSQPKYQALAWIIEQAIHQGGLKNKQKLPAQRLLADKLQITHGTVTRAYAYLEKKGIVKAKLGAGTYVHLSTVESEKRANIFEKQYDFSACIQPMLGQQVVIKKALADLSQDLSAIEGVMSYAYEGLEKHKQVFKSWLGSKNINIETKDISFIQGAQQGIFTCIQLLTKSNDYIMHEELTYTGFFSASEACDVNCLGVPLMSDGLDLQVLEEYCQTYQPKLLYIAPNMQNPTNAQYCKEKLDKIVALSRQYQFYIIEDDVNYCLPEDWNSPLQQQNPDRVFYISSLSKYIAGGLRVAYTLVPKQWQQAFNNHIHSQCWMVSTLNFELASRFLEDGEFIKNQACLADEIRYRKNVFKEMAERHDINVRCGGLNIWLTLPEHININLFNQALILKRIKVRAADLFLATNAPHISQPGFRISLGGFNTRCEFEEGVTVFEKVLMQLNNQRDIVI